MKKVIYSFIILFLAFLSPVLAADEKLFSDVWKDEFTGMIKNTYEINNKIYVVSDNDCVDTQGVGTSSVYIYDYNKGKISSKEYNGDVLYFNTKDKNILIVTLETSGDKNIIKALLTDYNLDNISEKSMDIDVTNITFVKEQDGIYYFRYLDTLTYYTVNKKMEITEVTLEQPLEETATDITDILEDISKKSSHDGLSTGYLKDIDQDGNYVLLSFHYDEEEDTSRKITPYLNYYNKDKKVIFSTKINNDKTILESFSQAKRVSNYLVVGVTNIDEDSSINTYFYIYNLEGELINTFSYEEGYNDHVISLIETEDGKGLFIGLGRSSSMSETPEDNHSRVFYYELPFTITTNIDGNGSIKLNKTNILAGEEVSFEITANKGYMIDQIKVVDSSGNIINVKDNKFIMPNSNVTIEVTFKTNNPKTSTFILPVIIIMFIALGVFVASYFYKTKDCYRL